MGKFKVYIMIVLTISGILGLTMIANERGNKMQVLYEECLQENSFTHCSRIF